MSGKLSWLLRSIVLYLLVMSFVSWALAEELNIDRGIGLVPHGKISTLLAVYFTHEFDMYFVIPHEMGYYFFCNKTNLDFYHPEPFDIKGLDVQQLQIKIMCFNDILG